IRARADAPAKTARPWLRRSALAGSLAQRLLLQRDAVDGGETGSERRRASQAGAIVAPLLARQGLEIRVLHDPGHPGRHVDVASSLAARHENDGTSATASHEPWFRIGAPRARPQRFAPVAAVLEPSPHWSGRGFGPRRSSGTLQLSTRCSSLALPPSRSLPVRFGWTLLASPWA